MKKLFLSTLLLGALFSCEDEVKIKECKAIADTALGEAQGFTISNAQYSSRKGLKLAVPDEYESSTHVVTISYKNNDGDYKGTTCYYTEKGDLMGSKSY